MSQSPDRKGFGPVAQEWVSIIVTAFIATVQGLQLYKEIDGDWSRLLAVTPKALAIGVGWIGGLCIIGLLLWLFTGRKAPASKPAPLWARLVFGLAAILLLLVIAYSMALRPDDDALALPGMLLSNWGEFLIRGAPYIGIGIAIVLLIAWWLGFSKRDHARATQRDRLNRHRD